MQKAWKGDERDMGRKRKKSRGHHTSDLLSVRLAHLLLFLTWNNAFLFFFNGIVHVGFSHLQERVFPGKGVSGKGNLQFLWKGPWTFSFKSDAQELDLVMVVQVSEGASMVLPLRPWALLLAVLQMASRWQRSLPPLSNLWFSWFLGACFSLG